MVKCILEVSIGGGRGEGEGGGGNRGHQFLLLSIGHRQIPPT